MILRTFRERLLQSAALEAGGILLAGPLYAFATGQGHSDGIGLVAVLAAAILVWSPLHNYVFDLIEARHTTRLASDRPHGLRVLHALSHELTSTGVTVPLIMVFGGLEFWTALAIDLGLSAFYTVYAFAFFWVYDIVRPIRAPLCFHSCRMEGSKGGGFTLSGNALTVSVPDLDS
jgi:uncharacterized membrane protein